MVVVVKGTMVEKRVDLGDALVTGKRVLEMSAALTVSLKRMDFGAFGEDTGMRETNGRVEMNERVGPAMAAGTVVPLGRGREKRADLGEGWITELSSCGREKAPGIWLRGLAGAASMAGAATERPLR